MDRLKGRFSISQVQPLNFGSGYFSSSNVGSYLDFNLTNINEDVLEEIYVVFNVTNSSSSTAVPLPAPLWIQSYSVWQGSNQWESQVPGEIILIENLLDMDDIKLENYADGFLLNPTTGQHDSTGIAAGVTQNVYVKMPAFSITNSFVFLPSLSQLSRLRIYLSGGNYMFTTSQQSMTLNQCYLEVHGIKYAPKVKNKLMQIHRKGNFVNKTSVYQHQIYNIRSSLSSANTQFQTILTSLQGEITSLIFWIRPSTQGGLTNYGLSLLEENLELSQVNYITDDQGLSIFQSLDEIFCRKFFPADHYPGGFRDNICYIFSFSLQLRLSSMNGSDVGHLGMNNNNVLMLTSGSAGSNGPYSLVVLAKTAAFLAKDQNSNVTLSYT